MVTNNAVNIATGATSTILQGQGVGSSPTFTGTPTVTSMTFGAGSALSTFIATTSFTPVLNFGGATTGITYSTQSGAYTQIGNVILFRIIIALSSKGSATGSATITGLPVSAATSLDDIPILNLGNFTFTGGFLNLVAITGANTSLSLTQINPAASSTPATNTNFANTSSLFFNGWYLS